MEGCWQKVPGMQSGWRQSHEVCQRQVRTVRPLHRIMAAAVGGSGGSVETPRLGSHEVQGEREVTNRQADSGYVLGQAVEISQAH